MRARARARSEAIAIVSAQIAEATAAKKCHACGCFQGAVAAFEQTDAGLLLSLVIAPCGTPVLASVLSFAAYKQSLVFGAALLFAYGIGVGLPMLVLGAPAGSLAHRLDRLGWRLWVDRLSGGTLVALGFYLLWVA